VYSQSPSKHASEHEQISCSYPRTDLLYTSHLIETQVNAKESVALFWVVLQKKKLKQDIGSMCNMPDVKQNLPIQGAWAQVNKKPQMLDV